MPKNLAPEIPLWNEVMVGRESMWYTPNLKRELDIPCLKLIEPVNDRLATAVDYRNYCLLKNFSRYDDDVAHDLNKITNMIAVLMKDRICSEKDSISVIAFRQEFKSACAACKLHEGEALWLFKKCLAGPTETDLKGWLTLLN